MPETNMPTRYLWLRVDSQSRWLWKSLAHHLAALTGLRPLLLVTTTEDRRYYETCFGEPLRADMVVVEDVYDYVSTGGDRNASEADLRHRAAQYEHQYDFSLMRHMVLADRHLGRGFIVDGQGHPISTMAERASLRSTLGACVLSLDFVGRLAERYPPAMIVCWGGGAGVGGRPLVLLARHRDIPFRVLASSRFGSLHYWGENEYYSCPPLEAHVKAFRNPAPAEIAAAQARVMPNITAAGPAVTQFHRSLSWPHIAKDAVRRILRHGYLKWRGYRRGRMGYRPLSVIASNIRSRLDWDWLDRHTRKDLKGLDGIKLVYFPLQVAPEATTLVLADRFSNQSATAIELALSLPADALLVIKEHLWQIGRRPRSIYKTLLSLPNVVFLHPSYPGIEVVRRADVVCALSSSAAHEAAVLGKHVAYLHPGSPLDALDHVHTLGSTGEFDQIRSWLLDTSPAAVSKRAQDGARYLMAIEEFSIDFGDIAYTVRQTPPTADELDALSQPLIEALRQTQPGTREPALS